MICGTLFQKDGACTQCRVYSTSSTGWYPYVARNSSQGHGSFNMMLLRFALVEGASRVNLTGYLPRRCGTGMLLIGPTVVVMLGGVVHRSHMVSVLTRRGTMVLMVLSTVVSTHGLSICRNSLVSSAANNSDLAHNHLGLIAIWLWRPLCGRLE